MSDRSKLQFILGTTDTGENVLYDFKSSGHALSIGETGSGQSSFMTGAFVTDIIRNYSPDQVKFVMIDTKFVQLSQYANIPHLLLPIITDINKAKEAINILLDEKQSRLDKFIEKGVADLDDYNEVADAKLPYIILLIPEIADLGTVADKDYFHNSLVNLLLLTHRLGIHLHLGTSHPSEQILPGILIANCAGRIVFKTSSEEDGNRLLFGQSRADKLETPGELYYSNPNNAAPIKLRAAYVPYADIESVVQRVKGSS